METGCLHHVGTGYFLYNLSILNQEKIWNKMMQVAKVYKIWSCNSRNKALLRFGCRPTKLLGKKMSYSNVSSSLPENGRARNCSPPFISPPLGCLTQESFGYLVYLIKRSADSAKIDGQF